jgi:mRNA interferase MazF
MVIAMITSNMSRAGHSSRITLWLNSPAGEQTRILMDSVVMTDNLATVRENEIDRALGALSDMSEVDSALRHTLSLH